jgi:hypothetical protein
LISVSATVTVSGPLMRLLGGHGQAGIRTQIHAREQLRAGDHGLEDATCPHPKQRARLRPVAFTVRGAVANTTNERSGTVRMVAPLAIGWLRATESHSGEPASLTSIGLPSPSDRLMPPGSLSLTVTATSWVVCCAVPSTTFPAERPQQLPVGSKTARCAKVADGRAAAPSSALLPWARPRYGSDEHR